ncbi:hypothetical protein M0R45_036295 [Rubus argutus]|uniref:Uncharacterized protein n=1 Tax=Rubus argutus TaxID=59490 RepID=A0AAW1W164_RUBAR
MASKDGLHGAVVIERMARYWTELWRRRRGQWIEHELGLNGAALGSSLEIHGFCFFLYSFRSKIASVGVRIGLGDLILDLGEHVLTELDGFVMS